MRSIELRLLAANSLSLIVTALFLACSLPAATHPRYGGTLHVELHAASVSLDPRQWRPGSLESAADEKLAELVFERLVALDNYGRFQPLLAMEWSHDNSNRHWRFVIRAGVKFSDGSPLSAEDVAAALRPLLPVTEQISASNGVVVIQSSTATPDLLEQLASGRFFIYRVTANGTLAGTGPFLATESPAPFNAAHLTFRANEDAWAGRPFVDGIDVTLGVPPLRALFDLQLGKTDLIELSPDLVPRARQVNLRVWTSEPVILYGLRFDDAQRIVSDPRLREALSLSLDRASMANVLLQKQAEPAVALLPQWLSGYAFLFSMEANFERSKELRRALPANEAAAASPLRLRVDAAGDLAKLIGERVALNARQAAILMQVVNRTGARTGSSAPAEPPAGAHLFAWHYSSLSPRAELDSLFAAYNLNEPSEETATSTNREQLYARERRVLGEWQVLPLVTLAESVGLGPTVRDWMPARWGEWHLADVWLDLPAPAQAGASNAAASAPPSSAQPRSATGAKP